MESNNSLPAIIGGAFRTAFSAGFANVDRKAVPAIGAHTPTRRKHNPVAVREVRSVYYIADYKNGRHGVRQVEVTVRHYLHATKGWKVERGSRREVRGKFSAVGWKDMNDLCMQAPTVGVIERRIPNPKHQRAA